MSFSVFQSFKNLKGFVFLTLYKIAFENLPSSSKMFSSGLLYLGVQVNWVRVGVFSPSTLWAPESKIRLSHQAPWQMPLPTKLSHWPPGIQF